LQVALPAGAEIKQAAQNAQLGAASVLIGIRPTFAQIESSLLPLLSSGSPGFVRRRPGRHGRCDCCRGA
jgi:hypothetical protein